MAKKLTFEEIRERGLLIYEYVRGSHAYGLATETSDEDRGGVYICPTDELLGLGFEYQTQVENDTHDIVWWELNRFMQLLIKSNPSVLEALFIPERCIIYEHPIMTEIKKHREKFITKACFNAFSGYSHQQIQKARGLNKKIVNPITERLEPLDFCYLIYKQGSSKLKNWLEYRGLNQKYCGLVNIPNMKDYYGCYYDWGGFFKYENITIDNLFDAVRDRTEYDTIAIVREMKKARADKNETLAGKMETLLKRAQFKNMVNFILDKYHLHISGPDIDEIEQDVLLTSWFNNQHPIGYCGIVGEDGQSNEVRFYDIERVEHAQKDENSVVLCSVPKGAEPICHIYYNKDGYSSHAADYKAYKDWEKNRNPERYRVNVEHNRGYDSKNMCQSARLMICGEEIAKTGRFQVDRSEIDRDFLLSIKRGEYPYDELIKFAEQKDAEMRAAMASSSLQENIDVDFVNDLLLDIRHRQLNGKL